MQRGAGVLLAVAALLAPAFAGCLAPFRPHVDGAVLAHASLPWARDDLPGTDGGLFGVNAVETDYTHSQGSGPPFPGFLQLFGVRTASRPSTQTLLDLTHTAVDNATRTQKIRIDESQSSSGSRTLQNGLQTLFFVEGGTSVGSGLFALNTKVRIIGEVGYDGRSSTSIIAVGIAQVESSTQCPIIGPCARQADLQTWIEMAGDPAGSVTGATTATGLIDHLVTHG
jgi:hypothetical protein